MSYLLDKIEDFKYFLTHNAVIYAYYRIKNFVKNIHLFIKLAYNWRPWDYSYTLDVFCTLLEKQAVALRGGYALRSEVSYRRCLTAAGKLRKAYEYGIHDDKSYLYLSSKNPLFLRRNTLDRGYTNSKEYYDYMYKVIRRRCEKEEKILKDDAWGYIQKHIEEFWD